MKEISQKIIDYAIWYYLKYYPSPKKLALKLKQKFWPDSEKWKKYGWINREEIDFIIKEKLKNILQEKEVIKSKIRIYKRKWKSKLYIKQKLFQRMENPDLIALYLEKAFINWELESIKVEYNKLKNKYSKQKIIEKLLRKWFYYEDIKKIIN